MLQVIDLVAICCALAVGAAAGLIAGLIDCPSPDPKFKEKR